MQNDIKSKLQSELSKATPSYERISELTEKLLDSNEDAVRFSVDAQHINRLGLELVSKQETALSELIKNSYDADARRVNIAFRNYDKTGGQLTIEDDGVGMDHQTIKSAWMRLSTNSKIASPFSTKYGRRRAGKKGIGRFAVQRLGKELILETKVKGEDQGHRVHFRWDEQFTAGKDIGTIWNRVETFDKEKKSHGTKLIINNLRDRWTNSIIEKVWKSVLLLQPPHKLANSKRRTETQKNKKHLPDPGFSVVINDVSSAEQEKLHSITNSFLSKSLAIISGSIDDKGNALVRVVSKKLGLDDTHKFEKKFLTTGDVHFKTHYFIYASELMTGITLKDATEMGHNFGGIRVYRDGFRVLPYGEPYDDWLKLAYNSARRSLLFPSNNNNYFGHVEISEENNPFLNETSSREGLIENDSFYELRDFLADSLEWAANRVAATREKKQTAGQKGYESKRRKESKSSVNEILEVLEKHFYTITDKGKEKESQRAYEEVKEKLENLSLEVEAQKEESLKYEAMLRILASAGISLSIFAHEIKGAFDSIKISLALLKKTLPKIEPTKVREDIGSSSTALGKSVDKIFDFGGYISKLTSNTESRTLKNVALTNVVDAFTKQFEDYMKNYNVKFTKKVDPPGLRTCKMHRSEVDSVLFNFLTNSIKSLEVAKPKDRKIKIEAKEKGQDIVIRFEDNGHGIRKEIENKIFDAFYTTADPSNDEVAGVGTGLGLKIVSDIASSYGGDVKLAPPSSGYTCCFEFRIPSNKKKMD